MNKMRPERIAYSLEDAAYACSVSRGMLRKEMYAGKLKAKKLGGKVLILREDLDAYLKTQLVDWEPSEQPFMVVKTANEWMEDAKHEVLEIPLD